MTSFHLLLFMSLCTPFVIISFIGPNKAFLQCIIPPASYKHHFMSLGTAISKSLVGSWQVEVRVADVGN